MNSPTSDVDTAVHQVLAAYRAAVLAKDANALAALYADDVVVFDAWGCWSYVGIAAWRALVGEWFRCTAGEQVQVELDELQVLGSANLVLAHAAVTFRAQTPAGVQLHALANRFSWALVLRAGVWKIVHEHSSLPIEPTTMKAISKR